jgi:hypothetical protein
MSQLVSRPSGAPESPDLHLIGVRAVGGSGPSACYCTSMRTLPTRWRRWTRRPKRTARASSSAPVPSVDAVGCRLGPGGHRHQHVPGLLARAVARAGQNSRQGFRRAAGAASGSPAASSSRTPLGSSCSYGEQASGRQKVTNLRLPGQYDERLFAAAGISGMQGPYCHRQVHGVGPERAFVLDSTDSTGGAVWIWWPDPQ